MKSPMNIHIFLLSFLLASATGFSAEEKKQEVYGNVAPDSALGKLLSVPGVDELYKQCDKDNQTKANIPNCIWDKVKVNPSLKKQVNEKYQEIVTAEKSTTTNSRSPASTSGTKGSSDVSLTSRNLVLEKDYNSDPGVKALSDFFGSKLAEVLHSDSEGLKDNKKITVVDHDKFISLYKTVLGKSLINSMTSYCLNTDQSKCVCLASDQDDPTKCVKNACLYNDSEAQKKNNIESLKNASFDTKSSDSTKWLGCIASISSICYDKPFPEMQDENDPNDKGFKKKDIAESKKQACLVMDFVKATRKNIILAEKQDEFYKNLGTSTAPKVHVDNFKALDEKKANNDALVSMGSGDLEKEFTVDKDGKKSKTSVKLANESLLKEAEACIDENDKIKNEAACKKFINTNKEENDKAYVEFALSQNIEEARLTEKLNDEKNITAYLKEEGYTKDQIDNMTKKENIAKIKQEIIDRFKSEKETIIAEMRSRIEAKTSVKNGDIKSNEGSGGKLSQIKEEFQSRTKDLGALIKFTNIVSSYLTVEDAGKKKAPAGRNTASLFSELNSLKDKEAKDLKKQIDDAKLSDSKSNPNLTVKEINCNLTKYDNQVDCDKAKKGK